MGISLQDWTELLAAEYLSDFIASGGSAVKIGVTAPHRTVEVLNSLVQVTTLHNYQFVYVDSAQTRVHMVDQIFFAIARQMDWNAIAEQWLRNQLHENGIRIPLDMPIGDLNAIADINDREKADLLGEIKRLITNGILRNYRLYKEFRTAVSALCNSLLTPQNVSPTDAETLQHWLKGEKCSLTELKKLGVHQRIGRHNARLMLGSLALWLHQVGFNGLTLFLDLNAVVSDIPVQEAIRYSRSTALDVYEVLRQFIDETDETENLLIVVTAGKGLLDSPKRSVNEYTALMMRVMNDVRDKDLENPLGALVRLDDF